MVDHGVNVPVLCHRGMSLKQMVAWAGKVGGNFTPLFLYCRVPKLLDVKQLTVNDPLSSGEIHAQALSSEKQEAGTQAKFDIKDMYV